MTGGVRICLAYNLVLRGKRGKTSAKAAPDAPADALAMSIGNWIATQPGKPLVFALEHHYTQRGLSLELLKGADRPLANEVVAAAEKGDCLVHLAQVSRHLLQFADDGSFDDDWSYSHRSRAPRRQAISVGETYEDELIGTDWTTLEGKKQPWCDIPFELSAIVASEPIDKWKPTSEEFEGYTGNAGNTLDRWYHRSAIVVWHRDQHFDVIVRSGPANSIPMFCSMAEKLPKTPKKRLDEARNDCVRFARAIAVQWPKRIGGFAPGRHLDDGLTEHFADHLPLLHDRDTISLFLSQMAAADQTVRLTSLLLAAGDEFGPCAFADEMRSLMSSPWTMRGRPEVPPRDIEWLSDFCCIWPNDAAKLALARDLCGLAVDRFCEPLPPPPKYFVGDFRREPSVSTTSLPLLLKGLAVVGLNDELSRVLRFVQTSPHEFDLDRCQVPVLKSLIPWAKKKLGEVPVLLAYWLDSVRYQLESVTAREPTPPTDWARPADVDCDCRFCGQLKAFLADPASEVGRIPAAEDKRQHLISMIARHRCDVTNTLERKGSPYSLVLTKTSGSFDRAVKRFATDQKLLEQLPVLK